jgi:cytochrome c oxidase subunit 2
VKRKNILLSVFAVFVVIVTAALLFSQIQQSIWGNEGKQLTTLSPQGESAQIIQDLVSPVFIVAGIVLVLVMVAVGYIVFRFRDTGDDDGEVPAQLHGNNTLEIGWTILPALILLVVSVLTVSAIRDLEQREDNAINVKVMGQQWWWAFQYDLNNDGNFSGPEDITTATELVIPVGTEIHLTQTSNDVIHSFWIPALNGKKDVVPGMDTYLKLKTDRVGVYRGQCTEFCGLSHANMRMLVRALPPEDYEAWKVNQLKPAPTPAEGTQAAKGKTVFEAQCAQCHHIKGVNDDLLSAANGLEPWAPELAEHPLQAGIAPDLTHLSSRGTMLGSIYNLHLPDGPNGGWPGVGCTEETQFTDCLTGDDQQTPGNPNNPLNRTALAAWLRNPPAMKPASADLNDQGKGRGMPNLGLSEDQINDLVAYLETLK